MLERTAVFGRGHGATKFELIFPSEALPPPSLPPLSYAALTYGMSATPCGQRRVIRIHSSSKKVFFIKTRCSIYESHSIPSLLSHTFEHLVPTFFEFVRAVRVVSQV